MNYHLFVNGVQVGPMAEDEVRRRIKAGEVSVEDQCWAEGWEEWRLIGDWLADASSKHSIDPHSICPSEWKIFYTVETGPTPPIIPPELYLPSIEDESSARNLVPEITSDSLVNSGCGLAFVGLLASLPIGTILFLISPPADGTEFVFGMAITSCVSAVIIGFSLMFNQRERKYKEALEEVIETRINGMQMQNQENILSFENREKAKVREVELKTIDCRSILSQDVPSQISEIVEAIADADQLTSRAEALLSVGAITPFWDAVDGVIMRLRSYDKAIGRIQNLSLGYSGKLRDRDHTFPLFPVTKDTLPNPQKCIDRLQKVVDLAFLQPMFCQIYEQRKTTSEIIKGFNGLNDAIGRLRNDLLHSLDRLKNSVDSGFRRVSSDVRSLESSQNQNAEELRDMMQVQHREQQSADEERSRREEKSQNQNAEALRNLMESQHGEQRSADKERSERDERYRLLSDDTLGAIRENTEKE